MRIQYPNSYNMVLRLPYECWELTDVYFNLKKQMYLCQKLNTSVSDLCCREYG